MVARVTAIVLLVAQAACAEPGAPEAGTGGSAPARFDFETDPLGLPAYSNALGVNDSGWIVGWTQSPGYARRAFAWRDGVTTLLDLGDGVGAVAWAINRRDQIVGTVDLADGRYQATLWDHGTVTRLGNLGGGASEATAVNDHGQVVGHSVTASGTVHAFLWEDRMMTDLAPGMPFAVARAINNRTQVVGMAQFGAEVHAALWEPGSARDLGVMGGRFSEALGINDAGTIVGWGDAADGPGTGDRPERRPFRWNAGLMVEMATLGGSAAYARGINALGQIVGGSTNQTGLSRPFLWDNDRLGDLLAKDIPAGWAEAINDRGLIVGSTDRAIRWARRGAPSPP